MSEPVESDTPRSSPDVPDWDDPYLDRVSDRLMFNYDLEDDYAVRGERFELYGRLEMSSEKHFFHPALRFGYHESFEHLFARVDGTVRPSDLERYVELGHDLAGDWIVADEQHFSTDFTFAIIVEEIPERVRSFVDGFRDRTLIKYGYHGHYEIHLVVVAPDEEDIVASEKADTVEAFRLWTPIEKREPGLWDLITRRLQI